MTVLLTDIGTIPHGILYTWSLLLIGMTGYRLGDVLAYQKHFTFARLNRSQAYRLYRKFFITAMLTALMVGISVPLFAPYLQDTYLKFSLFTYIIGITAGAMAALFPSLRLAASYATLTTLPMILYLFRLSDHYALLYVGIVILFIIVITLIAQTTHRYMREVYGHRNQLLEKEGELLALFEQTPIPIFYFDTNLKIQKYNQAFKDFFEIPPHTKLEGFDLNQLRHKESVNMMRSVLDTGQTKEYNGLYLSTFTPQEYWLQAKAAPLFNADGHLIGGVTSFQDKTIEIKSIEHLEELASLDPLTNLRNRRSLLQRLQPVVENQVHSSKRSLLYFLDLNQFKPINDTLGHPFGDRVLKEVADLLKTLVPENAEVFRHGGDEFVILHTDCCQTDTEAKTIGARFAKAINHAMKGELLFENYHLKISASIGIVIVTPQMDDANEIIRLADISMYRAKSRKQEYAFYDSEMDAQQRKRFFLHQELNREELFSQLELYYQPFYTRKCQQLIGAEALLRWRHPTLGFLSPAEFIPLAVESGEIHRIGRWVRAEVCKTLDELNKRGNRLSFISTNIDAREMGYEDFVPTLEQTLKSYNIDPTQLVIEITETTLMDNFELFHSKINQVKDWGVRWAIDDFGTGYSSLSYLEGLPFSLLKIDRSFITGIIENPNTSFLVTHIVEIASHFGYSIIAEGIETREQMKKLLEICPEIICQGYYFKHPMPQEDFFALLPAKEG
ncbi:EAL domain-containing protein [Nitratifractor sp.]|uniref:putative bifunctional diguanylate cyclase/phosphodiesterase n=1 Tax=Nitratifractor sp. TaxID=2268144 RepID=UPI0025E19CF4|nr:EAL domain-containing protein [Nitratifractor sp.]